MNIDRDLAEKLISTNVDIEKLEFSDRCQYSLDVSKNILYLYIKLEGRIISVIYLRLEDLKVFDEEKYNFFVQMNSEYLENKYS